MCICVYIYIQYYIILYIHIYNTCSDYIHWLISTITYRQCTEHYAIDGWSVFRFCLHKCVCMYQFVSINHIWRGTTHHLRPFLQSHARQAARPQGSVQCPALYISKFGPLCPTPGGFRFLLSSVWGRHECLGHPKCLKKCDIQLFGKMAAAQK